MKRSRHGCFTCRRRHYKCDEVRPNCSRCRVSGLVCDWAARDDPKGLLHKARNKEGQKPSLTLEILTADTECLQYYLSGFHNFSFEICAWTNLIDLPKRSIVPNVLRITSKNTGRRMTNWANFYLLHLATGTIDDPLSAAIAAYTALWMNDKLRAISFYLRVLKSLRRLLKRNDVAGIGNQEFLRIWSSVLLLALYEHQVENHNAAAIHLDGATTLCFVATKRFPIAIGEYASRRLCSIKHSKHEELDSVDHDSLSLLGSLSSQGEATTTNYVLDCELVSGTENTVPRNEMELPFYLARLTRLYRNINLAAPTLDVDWPDFWHNEESQILAPLLEKSSELFAHVLLLVQDFYIARGNKVCSSEAEYQELLAPFQGRYLETRECISQYQNMLGDLKGQEYAVVSSSAPEDFPFSPMIRFANPQMVQPSILPSLFLVLLAPFLSDEEHFEAIRYVSGVLAGRASEIGLRIDGSHPDLFLASFWRRGRQRDYFYHETRRRKGDFMLCLNRIWSQVDHIEDTQHRKVDKVEILGIALEEWRRAMIDGFKLQHNTFWQCRGFFTESAALATGSPDPRNSPYATTAVKARRRNFPDVSYFHHRISFFRENNGFNLDTLRGYTQAGRIPNVREQMFPARMIPTTSIIAETKYTGVENLDSYDENIEYTHMTTEAGKAASRYWKKDPDASSLYFII